MQKSLQEGRREADTAGRRPPFAFTVGMLMIMNVPTTLNARRPRKVAFHSVACTASYTSFGIVIYFVESCTVRYDAKKRTSRGFLVVPSLAFIGSGGARANKIEIFRNFRASWTPPGMPTTAEAATQ